MLCQKISNVLFLFMQYIGNCKIKVLQLPNILYAVIQPDICSFVNTISELKNNVNNFVNNEHFFVKRVLTTM